MCLCNFCHCWKKRGTEPEEHCTQNVVKNKEMVVQGSESQGGEGE